METVESILRRIAAKLDISDTMAQKAKTAYEAVGAYLQSELEDRYVVDIHPQGSFNLGTVVKPTFGKDEYDIDLVCLLNDKNGYKPVTTSAYSLKNDVGDSLKSSERYKDKLDAEGKRCWTLQYSEFHMDILPCRSAALEYQPSASEIELTNKNSDGAYSYLPSNPSGYRQWFRERMRVNLNESEFRNFALEKLAAGEIEKVPEYKFRTPLQRTIQLLKRHRDVFFSRLPEERRHNKPISMIITTLAAMAYQGERTIVGALTQVLMRMTDGISHDDEGNTAIWNPAVLRERENFAEKWRDAPEKESEFNVWLCKARKDFTSILGGDIGKENLGRIRQIFGESVSNAVFSEAGIHDTAAFEFPLALYQTASIYDLFHEDHRLKAPGRDRIRGWVNVSGWYVSPQTKRLWSFTSNSMPLSKNLDLVFRMKTNIQGRYNVMWQVVNTGSEASAANCLRGDYGGGTSGRDGYGDWHKEQTRFSGTHYLVCYVMQNGECVAKSSEFVVNIK